MQFIGVYLSHFWSCGLILSTVDIHGLLWPNHIGSQPPLYNHVYHQQYTMVQPRCSMPGFTHMCIAICWQWFLSGQNNLVIFAELYQVLTKKWIHIWYISIQIPQDKHGFTFPYVRPYKSKLIQMLIYIFVTFIWSIHLRLEKHSYYAPVHI